MVSWWVVGQVVWSTSLVEADSGLLPLAIGPLAISRSADLALINLLRSSDEVLLEASRRFRYKLHRDTQAL